MLILVLITIELGCGNRKVLQVWVNVQTKNLTMQESNKIQYLYPATRTSTYNLIQMHTYIQFFIVIVKNMGVCGMLMLPLLVCLFY
jgi:hypothetical protein